MKTLYFYRMTFVELSIRLLFILAGLILLLFPSHESADFFTGGIAVILIVSASFRPVLELTGKRLFFGFTDAALIIKQKYFQKPGTINWKDITGIEFKGYHVLLSTQNSALKIKYTDRIYNDLRTKIREYAEKNNFEVRY